MGLDSKLFVATKKENILHVMPKVIEGLNTYIRAELDAYLEEKGFSNRMQFMFRDKESELNKGLKDFSNGISECTTYDFRSWNINFKIQGENRSLFVTHTCSNDYKEVYDGDKIIFSLGYWGLSDEIMKVVAESLKEFGDVYYDFNDCDDEDFVKLN
jgi:hypothetical protein